MALGYWGACPHVTASGQASAISARHRPRLLETMTGRPSRPEVRVGEMQMQMQDACRARGWLARGRSPVKLGPALSWARRFDRWESASTLDDTSYWSSEHHGLMMDRRLASMLGVACHVIGAHDHRRKPSAVYEFGTSGPISTVSDDQGVCQYTVIPK